MVEQLGYPSDTRVFVFNGDYVDRGSWGVEVLTLLCALKCAAPKSVVLLRGNHESSTCTKYYGYYQEVRAKYGKQAKDVYAASKRLFSTMPLAALIANSTLVMHGGLFRRPPEPKRGAKRRKPSQPARGGAGQGSELAPGSLDDLRRAGKGGMDPDGCGSSLLATDVLWSDPVAAPGFRENDARGVGLVFGPDVTESFLRANGLRLIIRSHEGPDARDKRSDLPQVLRGYSFDHNTPAGQLVTVFSAPDYPQFQAVEEDEEEEKGQEQAGTEKAQAEQEEEENGRHMDSEGGQQREQQQSAAAAGDGGEAAANGKADCGASEAGAGGGEGATAEAAAEAGPGAEEQVAARRPGQRYDNLAAVAVLSAPDYATPVMRTFAAVRPRPKADPYYDFAACCDSDAEAPAGSDASGGGSGSEGHSGAASDADMDAEGDQAEGPPPQGRLQGQGQQGQGPERPSAAGGDQVCAPAALDGGGSHIVAPAEGQSGATAEAEERQRQHGVEGMVGAGRVGVAGEAAQPMEIGDAGRGASAAPAPVAAADGGGESSEAAAAATCAMPLDPPPSTPDPKSTAAAGGDAAGALDAAAGTGAATTATADGSGPTTAAARCEGDVSAPAAEGQAAAQEAGQPPGEVAVGTCAACADVEMAEAQPAPAAQPQLPGRD